MPLVRLEFGIAGISDDAPLAIVDDERGERRLWFDVGGLAPQQRFDLPLQQRIDRRALHHHIECIVAQRARQMDRVEGQGDPMRRHRLGARLHQRLLGDDALVAQAREHRVPR